MIAGVTLPEARRLTNLTAAQLEDLAGVSRGTVVDIERGKNTNPSHAIVTKLVRALQGRGLAGLTANELFPVDDATGSASAKPSGVRA